MKDWLAIDVSKASLAVALEVGGRKRPYEREVDNDAKGLARLLRWVSERGSAPEALTVVMEATGVYHEQAALTLHEGGCRVIIANPKRARDFAQGIGLLHKTDSVDARGLLSYAKQQADELVAWAPPPVEVRELRALYGRLVAVQEDLQREENRYEQARISTEPTVVIESLQRSVERLALECTRLQRAIEEHFDQHPGLHSQRELLQSIPGVGPAAGDLMLCLLLSHRFKNARQAAAFCGLIPRTHQSGTILRRSRMTKQGDALLRAKLYMPAVVASTHNPRLREVYQRLLRAGKAKMAAIGALMRQLVHIAFGVLKHQVPFDPARLSRNA